MASVLHDDRALTPAEAIERWWQEGVNAAYAGESLDACPYPILTLAWQWWERAYRSIARTRLNHRRWLASWLDPRNTRN